MLLSLVCPVISANDGKTASIVARYWLETYDKMDQSDVLHALTTLSILAPHTSVEIRSRLVSDLMGKLKSYSVPLQYIKHIVVTISQVNTSNVAYNGR